MLCYAAFLAVYVPEFLVRWLLGQGDAALADAFVHGLTAGLTVLALQGLAFAFRTPGRS